MDQNQPDYSIQIGNWMFPFKPTKMVITARASDGVQPAEVVYYVGRIPRFKHTITYDVGVNVESLTLTILQK